MDLAVGEQLRKLPGPVLITGHTGFKGTWLTLLLQQLNVSVIGLSLAPEKDSLFDRADRTGLIPEACLDVRDAEGVADFFTKFQPSAVIHMAAQPLVLESYVTPRETFETNVMGTVNVLNAALKTTSVSAVVIVTTDKVYRNENTGAAFKESDPLEGKDPYSASKVGAEAAVAAWQQIAKVQGGPKVISVRAGNVIGGGDWSLDRLVPDLVRGLISGEMVQVRNPESTRPWQHVLDPLHGYVMALEALLSGQELVSLNFGPSEKSMSVREICQHVSLEKRFPGGLKIQYQNNSNGKESKYLGLDSSQAGKSINWKQRWSQKEALNLTLDWWSEYLLQNNRVSEICNSQIQQFYKSS